MIPQRFTQTAKLFAIKFGFVIEIDDSSGLNDFYYLILSYKIFFITNSNFVQKIFPFISKAKQQKSGICFSYSFRLIHVELIALTFESYSIVSSNRYCLSGDSLSFCQFFLRLNRIFVK